LHLPLTYGRRSVLCSTVLFSRSSRSPTDDDNYSSIIDYVENDKLPADTSQAHTLVFNRDNFWFIDAQGVLFHVDNPRNRNVNSVKPIIHQIAVLESLRPAVLVAFHDNISHFRLEKCCATIKNEKSARRRRKHCALAVVRRSQKFRSAADPFPGARDGQNLISWRCSLPLPAIPVW